MGAEGVNVMGSVMRESAFTMPDTCWKLNTLSVQSITN